MPLSSQIPELLAQSRRKAELHTNVCTDWKANRKCQGQKCSINIPLPCSATAGFLEATAHTPALWLKADMSASASPHHGSYSRLQSCARWDTCSYCHMGPLWSSPISGPCGCLGQQALCTCLALPPHWVQLWSTVNAWWETIGSAFLLYLLVVPGDQ